MLGWRCNDGNHFIDKESRCTNISVPNWIWGLYSWRGPCLVPELLSWGTEVLKLFQWWHWFFVCLYVCFCFFCFCRPHFLCYKYSISYYRVKATIHQDRNEYAWFCANKTLFVTASCMSNLFHEPYFAYSCFKQCVIFLAHHGSQIIYFCPRMSQLS